MKLAIDSKMWTEPRFQALTARSGWSRERAIGLLVLFWHGTKEAGLAVLSKVELPMYLPVKDVDLVRDLLLQCGYLKDETPGGGYEVVGNRKILEMVTSRRKWASKGGQATWSDKNGVVSPAAKEKEEEEEEEEAGKEPMRARPTPLVLAPELAKSSKVKADTEGNRACWDAYREAFAARYRMEPGRNAMVNANVSTFVKRIGRDMAPEVIRFYLSHSDPTYIRACHPINLAVKDAHALLTQCRKGYAITTQDAVNAGRVHAVQSQLSRISSGDL